jgi:alpha-pyrone synthase
MKAYLHAIGTSVPTPVLQTDIARFMTRALELSPAQQRQLQALYRSTGIHQRHSVIEDYSQSSEAYTFFSSTQNLEPFPTVSRRMELYRQHVLPLSLKAIGHCLHSLPQVQPKDITHLITISCTGMYAPGLDVALIESLGLSAQVQRMSIHFMGCYAALTGLRLAQSLCQSAARVRILLVAVELCTLHFQKKNTPDNLLANALFSDGAAALLIENQAPQQGIALSVEHFHTEVMLTGQGDMAWKIGDFGFEMLLSSYVPDVIESGIKKLTDRVFESLPYCLEDMSYFAMHPGGKRILEVLEKELSISKEDNRFAYQVLRDFGNMSSPTVLFVFQKLWEQLKTEDHEKKLLSFAFGPGLTLEALVLKVVALG